MLRIELYLLDQSEASKIREKTTKSECGHTDTRHYSLIDIDKLLPNKLCKALDNNMH